MRSSREWASETRPRRTKMLLISNAAHAAEIVTILAGQLDGVLVRLDGACIVMLKTKDACLEVEQPEILRVDGDALVEQPPGAFEVSVVPVPGSQVAIRAACHLRVTDAQTDLERLLQCSQVFGR